MYRNSTDGVSSSAIFLPRSQRFIFPATPMKITPNGTDASDGIEIPVSPRFSAIIRRYNNADWCTAIIGVRTPHLLPTFANKCERVVINCSIGGIRGVRHFSTDPVFRTLWAGNFREAKWERNLHRISYDYAFIKVVVHPVYKLYNEING